MFAYLYRTFYEVLLQSDDDFFTRCRKAVITAFFGFGLITIVPNTASAVNGTDEWTVVVILNNIAVYITSAIWIASWVFVKRTRTSPDWLINLPLDSSLCRLVLMLLSSPNWGYHCLCLVLAITGILIGSSHMKLQVAVCCFCFILNVYDALGLPSILLPGSYIGSKRIILIRQIFNGVAAGLALWIVYVAMKQFWVLIAKSAANVRLAREVSKKLATYDTVGALALLSDKEQSAENVDAGLVAVLTQIAHNLDKYRSYLPSYLLRGGALCRSDACRRGFV